MSKASPQIDNKQIDFSSDAYRNAYSRINGVVVVGEALADRHFRLLAKSIPEDRDVLLRLGAMEGRHAVEFVGCGRNLGIKPDTTLAKKLFAPLHELFLKCDHNNDLPGCLVIQGLIVECFAVAAYKEYLPVADPYAKPITASVLDDEAEHLEYAECWLKARFQEVEATVSCVSSQALPITLSILQNLANDMRTIGMNPVELVAIFSELFQKALENIGYESRLARGLIIRAATSVPLN